MRVSDTASSLGLILFLCHVAERVVLHPLTTLFPVRHLRFLYYLFIRALCVFDSNPSYQPTPAAMNRTGSVGGWNDRRSDSHCNLLRGRALPRSFFCSTLPRRWET